MVRTSFLLIALFLVGTVFSQPDLILDYEQMEDTLELSVRNFAAGSCELDADHLCIDSPGVHTLLRFTQTIVNIGRDDLVLPDTPSGGNPDPSGFYHYSPCHNHYHWENFLSYTLFDSEGNEIAGHKASWCVLDVAKHHYYNDTLPWYDEEAVPDTREYTCGNMGLSVGWGDTYVISSPCQYVQMDVPAGEYNLRIEINRDDPSHPERRIDEMNYENNVVTYPITLFCAEFSFFPSAVGYVDPTSHSSTPPLGSEGYFNVSLPQFRFFCHDQNDLYIHANGFVSFGSPANLSGVSEKGLALIPNSFAVLFANWSDTPSGEVKYDVSGSSPNRVVVITWLNVTNGVDTVTFQLVLDEANGIARAHYVTVPSNSTPYVTGTCSNFYPGDCTTNGFALTPGAEYQWTRLPSSLDTSTRPIADAGGPYEGNVDEPITFDGSGSVDPQGEELTYTWLFGDMEGLPGHGVNPTYTYTECGAYDVQLSVSDGFHQSEVVTTQACVCSDECDGDGDGSSHLLKNHLLM